MEKQFLPVIAGPTASGKTALAIALAKAHGGEIISADSMQIYRELHIATARPLPEEWEGVPHHLLGFQPLAKPFSVAEYTRLAHAAIAETAARGRQPILCGGTGLYIRAVTENLQFADEPQGDRAVRARLRERAEREGGATLLAELTAVDPETAARLHENDVGRIVRALELYTVTGRTLTEQNRLSRAVPSPYRVRMLVLDARDRSWLYDRIDRRVDAMLAAGLLNEARQALTVSAPTARQAIGCKELASYFAGEVTLAEAVDNLKRQTRRYAKRQLSWFHGEPSAVFLYADDYPDAQALAAAADKLLFAD